MSSPKPTQPRISRFWPFKNLYYGWAVLVAGAFSSFAMVPTQGPIVGVFNQPMRDDLGWSAIDISIAFVIGSVGGGFMSSVVGRVLDKRGPRVVSVLAGLVIATAMVAISRMTEPWHWWVLFGVARATAASGAQLATLVGLASWFVRKRGRVVGLLGVGQRGGQFIMPLPLVAIMAFTSWREAWIVLAVVVILLQVLPSAALYRRRPEDYGLLPDGAEAPPEERGGVSKAADSVEDSWTLAQAKRTRTLWLLIVAQGGVILCLNATNLHAAAHLQDRGLSLWQAGAVTTVFAGASMLTVLPWGFAMERLHVRTLGLMSTAMLVVAMVLVSVADTFPLALLFGFIYGIAIGAWTVVSRMLFANYFGRRNFGAIRGFAAPLMAIVNPAGPLLAAYFRDSRGEFDLAFYFFAGVFVLSFLAFLLATPLKNPPPTAVFVAP
ncbi:MAG: MFS transporter [Chloroflexi bacterium]|nr:MFS transporter [Chloroflexota bacterium]MDA1173879.1 MFS transporter [Chloroflexota bacterium]